MFERKALNRLQERKKELMAAIEQDRSSVTALTRNVRKAVTLWKAGRPLLRLLRILRGVDSAYR